MRLHEITQQHSRIERWLRAYKITNYTIRPDGIVDVDGDVTLKRTNIGSIFVQFGKVTGDFSCFNTNITSLYGAPQYVGGEFFCHGTNITSLDGAPRSVGSHFYCHDTKIVSLAGINKIIERINGVFITNRDVTHILGLVLIEGMVEIRIAPYIDQIMNKYLGTRDILSAQDELIDAGFIEQARL